MKNGKELILHFGGEVTVSLPQKQGYRIVAVAIKHIKNEELLFEIIPVYRKK